MLSRSVRITWQRSLSLTAAAPKGHSHWQNIKDTKEKHDRTRAKAIGTLLNKAKHYIKYGTDLKLNKDLAAVQKEFKAQSLPMETFDKYIEKMKNKKDFTKTIDIIGPSGSLFVIEIDADRLPKMNRELKKFFPTVGTFRFGNEGIRNQFVSKGIVRISGEKATQSSLEQMEEMAIELDCDEVNEEDGAYEFVCDVSKHGNVEKSLGDRGYDIELAEIQLRALHCVTLSDEDAASVEKLYAILEQLECEQVSDNIESDGSTILEAAAAS